MKLSTIHFFDLFISSNPADAWFKESPGSRTRFAIPKESHEEIMQLHAHLLRHTVCEFKIDWDNIRYRVERREVVPTGTIFVCRRFLIRPDNLADLGVPKGLADKLLAPDVDDGLILLLGGIGTGKSTFAGTLTKERLSLHGGVAWTIENPVEADLTVKNGRGIVYQAEVKNEDEVGNEIVKTLRSSPNMIYIGEIRKNSAAIEAVQAAHSGHLVLSTQHGNSAQAGLARLASKTGSTHTIADALRAAIWLDLKKSPSGQMRLITETLWVTGTDNEDGIRSTLRKGDFHLLKNDIDRQRRRLQEGLPL